MGNIMPDKFVKPGTKYRAVRKSGNLGLYVFCDTTVHKSGFVILGIQEHPSEADTALSACCTRNGVAYKTVWSGDSLDEAQKVFNELTEEGGDGE